MTNYITKTIKNGVEANIPVTSVNGQYGDVTIQTGGNYTAGNGIDITNDEIGLDGTYSVGFSDMQGPCPDGFHVPLYTEWVALCGVLTTTFSLAQNATTMGTYLKMPRPGFRNYSNSNVSSVGSDGYYWSSSAYSAPICLKFTSSSISSQYNYIYSDGCSIRCFKNRPEIPTSSWTTLYDGSSVASGAGIFYNATDGLISVSGDGTTWYTIQDKNLGATTVFNQGDSLTANNCGNFYQWGNNYGFPRPSSMTPDIIKSSTQVDASNYGPGNYYSSSTFITGSSNWDSSSNSNLWGGVSGANAIGGNLVLGDKLYKIVTSTTAPASGTASNIITFVTD